MTQAREQVYPLEQINATLLLTDAQGTAIWQKEAKFSSHLMICRTASPPREMQEQMWRAFDAWTRGNALAALKV